MLKYYKLQTILSFIPIINALSIIIFMIQVFNFKYYLKAWEIMISFLVPVLPMFILDSPMDHLFSILTNVINNSILSSYIMGYFMLLIFCIGILLVEKYLNKLIEKRNNK